MYTFKYSNLFVMYFQLHLYWHKMFFFFSPFLRCSAQLKILIQQKIISVWQGKTPSQSVNHFFSFFEEQCKSFNASHLHQASSSMLNPFTSLYHHCTQSLSLSLSLNNFDFLFKWIKINLPKRNKFWDYSCLQYACTYIWYCYLLAKLLFWKYMNICVFP